MLRSALDREGREFQIDPPKDRVVKALDPFAGARDLATTQLALRLVDAASASAL
jgi:hypothetical protein